MSVGSSPLDVALHVDRLVAVRRLDVTESVVVAEPEADGIHHVVAAAAGRVRLVLAQSLPHRHSGLHRGRRRNVRRRGGELLAEEHLAHELPAVDRPGFVRLRHQREERGQGQEPRGLTGGQREALERVVPAAHAVVPGEVLVHEDRGRREERRERAALPRQHVAEEGLRLALHRRRAASGRWSTRDRSSASLTAEGRPESWMIGLQEAAHQPLPSRILEHARQLRGDLRPSS